MVVRRLDIQDLRREEVEDARRMPESEKLSAGGELFDYACWITKAGIRMQHPDADEQQVLALLRRRLEIRDQREGKT